MGVRLNYFSEQMQALQNMYDYLLDAESQMGTDQPDDGAAPTAAVDGGGPSVPVAAGAGDTNICGGIVQFYWEKVLGRSLDLNGQVRQTALKVKNKKINPVLFSCSVS